MIANRPINIALIEDNPGDIRLTQEALGESNMDFHLEVLMDGLEAIKYLHRTDKYSNAIRPDIILLDLNLPKKDGREVLAFIKSHSELKRIPVLVLTTSNSEADITRAYDYHANCYITKPIDFNEFIDIVRLIESFWIKTVKLPSDL